MMHKVFVKVDDAGRVLAINSDAFLLSLDGWTKIDEGSGDRFHHAQGNYLPGVLYDEYGVTRYKMVDGVLVERTAEEMQADRVQPEARPTIEARVQNVESKTGELEEAIELLLSGVTE